MDEEKKPQSEEEKKEESVEKAEKKPGKTEKKPKKQKNKTVRRLLGIIALLLVALIIVVVLFASALLKKTSVAPSTGAEEVAEKFEQYYGTVEGSLSYPSEFIPPMMVCAKEKKTKEEFCTGEQVEDDSFEYGIGYSLEVPAGSYEVYAQLMDEEGELDDFKAYYSKYVTCGMTYECESHDPITVKIEGGDTKSGISPMDWLGE